MSIGERIKDNRIDKRMTQQQLADLLNLSRPTVAKYEKDVIQPSADILIKIADVFDISLDYLLGRKVNKNSSIEVIHTGDEEFSEEELRALATALKILKASGKLDKYLK